MGLPVYELVSSDDAVEVITDQHLDQPLCSLCELVYIMFEILERIVCGMDISMRDLRAYQMVAENILAVAKQQSELELSGTVKYMRILRDRLLPVNPFPERQTAARRAVLEVQVRCSSRCTWEQTEWRGGFRQRSKAGSKRALTEMEMETETETEMQHFEDYCGSTVPEGPSRKIKHFGNVVHITEAKWPGQSGGSRNPNPEHLNGEECNKSIHEISFYTCHKENPRTIREDRAEEVIPLSCPDSVPASNDDCKNVASSFFSMLLAKACAVRDLPASGLRWLSRKKRTVSAPREKVQELIETTEEIDEETAELGEETAELDQETAELDEEIAELREETAGTGWDSLPCHLQENILLRVEFKDLFRFKTISKSCNEYIESHPFRQWRGATSSPEGLFTAINYYIKNKTWRCSGYDLRSRMWRKLPTFSPTLPAPDAELFKDYSVSGHGGLMCADVAKLPKKGELLVFNPLTRKTLPLPSLLNPRSPVLVHLSVDSMTKSYKVIVAGSSTACDEHLSKKMEVFDSETSKWEEAPDLPGPAFGLNEHQAGVCVDGVLYFISFLEGNSCRGVVAFDVENKKWLDNKACPISFSMYSNTLQLVESNGKVYLFSEREQGGSVEHCIDMLEIVSPNAGAVEKCQWRNVVCVKKSGGRGLQVYPEHTCVNFGDEKLCVFNTLTRDGVVYDMRDGKQVEVLQPPPLDHKGDNFFSLNPASFTLRPSFDSDPVPPVDPN